MISFNKITSIVVAACFILTSVGGSAAASVGENMRATEQYKQIFSDFMLPYSYGKITDAHFASTDRVIINIQDLHCHPKVQKNISNIIGLFDKRYGVKTVYLEGAYGDVDTNWIGAGVDTNYKSKLLDKMIETGRLTGAEYYSALSGKTNIIKGLESKEPYLENLKRFGEMLENKDKINVILESVEKSGNELRTKYYDRRQLKIEELSKQYEFGKITAEKYYVLLAKHIDRLGIDITGYENTLNYMALMAMQKNLKYDEITNQLQALVFALKGTLPPGAYKMLLDSTGNLSQIDKLYGCLIKITRQYNLDMSVNYLELDKYFAYIELSQKINPLGLLEENKKLTEEINSRFSNTKAQAEVVFVVNFEKYLRDCLTSKITAVDYEYYKENIAKYKKLWAKYVDNKVLSLLDAYMAQADRFYEINSDRNVYFAGNIFDGVSVSPITPVACGENEISNIIGNMPQTKRVDVIITGGFHTGTVSEILKNRNVSYIVITPNVTDGLKDAEETYYKIAKEQSKISFQTLANLIASLSPVEQKRVLIAADPSLESKLGFIPENAESVLTDAQIKQLAEVVKMSEVLLSDDNDNLKEQIIQNIKDRLEKSNSELAGKIDGEVLKHVNMDKLKTAFEKTKELEKLISYAVKVKDVKNEPLTGQTLAAVQELASKITQAIGMLRETATVKKSPAETSGINDKSETTASSPEKKGIEQSKQIHSDIQKNQASQQKKSGLIFNIKKRILPFILAVSIIFIGLFNASDYHAPITASAESSAVVYVSGEAGVADNDYLWDYLHNTNEPFAPSNKDEFNKSIEISNGSQAKELTERAYEMIELSVGGITSKPEILFVIGSQAPLYSACACSDINLIIIPIGADLQLPSAAEIAGKIAHEYTHIKNYQKVMSGEISQLEDETMATEAGIITDTTYEHNTTIESRYNGTVSVNGVSAMELFAFYSILDNQETLTKEFIKITGNKNITFADLYYSGVFFSPKNKAGLPSEITLGGLSENEVAIRLYYGNTSVMYVVNVDGNEYSLSRIEVLSDNFYVKSDKEKIISALSDYDAQGSVFGKQDIIDGFDILSVSEALLKACSINLNELRFVYFNFPYDEGEDTDADIIRFIVQDENGNFYGIDIKKDKGIVKIVNNSTGENLWQAKLSKDIISSEASQGTEQRNSVGISISVQSSKTEKSAYSKIYKLSVNKLKAFVLNENNDISERFLAFLILKNQGINIQIPEEMLTAGRQYIRDIESGKAAIITSEEIENNKYKTANDRLKSALTAVYYIMLNSYINEFNIDQAVLDGIWKSIYENAEVTVSNSSGADSSLSFQPDSLTADIMAHELLHNITDVYLGTEKNLTSSAFAEFSSDIAKIVLCEELGIDIPSDLKDRYKEYAAYIKVGAVPLEEHYLARGIIGLIMEVSVDTGRNINWNNMMSAVSQCLQNADFINLINSNNFNKVFALVLEKYLEIETGRPVDSINVSTQETSELYNNIVKLLTPRLTMTWLSKWLDKKGITGHERENIINKKENIWIVLGVTFPNTIGRIFAYLHLTQEEKTDKTAKEAKINSVRESMRTVTDAVGFNIPTGNFIRKLIKGIVFYKENKILLALAHTAWNRNVKIPEPESKTRLQDISDEEKEKLETYLKEHKKSLELTYGENPCVEWNAELQSVFAELLDAMVAIGKITEKDKEEYELIFIYSDNFSAYTVKNSKSVFITTGVISELQKYFGAGFSRDHVAAILAHELQHTIQSNKRKESDFEAKGGEKRKEYNSDIEALYVMDWAGFNPKASSEVMNCIDKKGSLGSLLMLPDAHPDTKGRLKVIDRILQDKNVFFINIQKEYQKYTNMEIIFNREEWIRNEIKKVKTAEDLRKIFKEYGNVYDILSLLKKYSEFANGDTLLLADEIRKLIIEEVIEKKYPGFNRQEQLLIFEVLFGYSLKAWFIGKYDEGQHTEYIKQLIDGMNQRSIKVLKDFFADYKVYSSSLPRGSKDYQVTAAWIKDVYFYAFFYLSEKLNFTDINNDYDKLFQNPDISEAAVQNITKNFIASKSLDDLAVFMETYFLRFSPELQDDIIKSVSRIFLDRRYRMPVEEFININKIIKVISSAKKFHTLSIESYDTTYDFFNFISRMNNKKEAFSCLADFLKVVDVEHSKMKVLAYMDIFENLKQSGITLKEIIDAEIIPDNTGLFFKIYGDELKQLSPEEVKEIIDKLIEYRKFYENSGGIYRIGDRVIKMPNIQRMENSIYTFLMIYLCKKNNIDFDYFSGKITGSFGDRVSYESLAELDEEYGYANNKKEKALDMLDKVFLNVIAKGNFDVEKILRFSRYLTKSKVPASANIYMDDEEISKTPVEILMLFRSISNIFGKELVDNYDVYIELKTWNAVKKKTEFSDGLEQILNHFHSSQELRSREFENLWISFLCKTAGLAPVQKSAGFFVNFEDVAEPEKFYYSWYEINNDIFKQKLTASQINEILANYGIIKKYLSAEQKIQFGRLIYSLIKKNGDLSVFKDINEHIALMNFLFEEASPAKDDVIYDIFGMYDMDSNMNNYLVSLLTSKIHDDDSAQSNKRVMEKEIFSVIFTKMSKHDKSEILIWLLNDKADMPVCLKNMRLSEYKNGDYVLNFNNLRYSFRMMSPVEKFEIINILFNGEKGFFDNVEKDLGYLSLDTQILSSDGCREVFVGQYIPNLLADIENEDIGVISKIEEISDFYEIFVLPLFGVNDEERKKILDEKQKIIDSICLNKNLTSCKTIINRRKDLIMNSKDKSIKSLFYSYVSNNTKKVNLSTMYMFFSLLPLSNNLKKDFENYVKTLDKDIFWNWDVGNPGIAEDQIVKRINVFYKYFVFPVYGENEETLAERGQLIEIAKKLSRCRDDSEAREVSRKNPYSHIMKKYLDSGIYTHDKLKSLLEGILDIKALLKGDEISIYDSSNEMFCFVSDVELGKIRNVLVYNSTIDNICEILFGGMGKLSYIMKQLFLIVLTNSTDEQKVVFINDILGKAAEISQMESGGKYSKAKQLGRMIVSIGANSGVGVVKLLQMFANGKTFTKLGETGEEGEIINAEIAKIQAFSDPLYKSTMFAILHKEGILDDGVIIGKLLGAASIAQTHILTLKDGRKVVAKFKRPSAAKNLDADFKILEDLLRYFKTNYPDFALPEARQVDAMIKEELDFSIEMNAAIKVSDNVKKRKSKIRIPKIYRVENGELVEEVHEVKQSVGENVFFQEYIDGEPLSRKSKSQKSKVYYYILQEFFEEVFEDGFFHADLHEGNIMIDKQGRIVFIDFGGCGQIRGRDEIERNEKKQALKNMVLAVFNGEYEKFERAIMAYNSEIYEKIKNKGKLKELREIITNKWKIEKKFTDMFILLNTADEQGMDKDFLMFFQSLSKIGKYLDNLSGPDKLKIFSYLNKGQLPPTLQNKSTVEKLQRIGNMGFIKRLYGGEGNKTGENFRYTNLGIAIGVILETFSLWSPNFINSHENPTMGMKIAVWVVRALSIGLSITVALSPVSPFLIAPAFLLTEWITHSAWNKIKVSKDSKEQLLQTGNDEKKSGIDTADVPKIKNALIKVFPEYQKFFTDEDIAELITYSVDFFNGFPDEKVFEKNLEELVLSVLDPGTMAVAIRPFRPAYLPRVNPPDELRKLWFKEIAEECAKHQKDYLNNMNPDIRNKFFAAKLLQGANLENITKYLGGLKKSGLLSMEEKNFLDNISLDGDIGKQLVIEKVIDYSSSRIANEGNIVLKVTLKNLSGGAITFFIKGLDKEYKISGRKNAKYHSYENTFYWFAGLLGLHSTYIDFYPTPSDRYAQGYSIMQVIPGEDTSQLFDIKENGPSHFKIKNKYRAQKDSLIASFAVFAALTDLLGRGDTKIIKTHHPMFSANYMFDVLENGEIKIYPIDAALLFNPDNSHVIKTMKQFGDLELGITLAFYEDKNDLKKMLELYRKEYLKTWEKIKRNADKMKEYILSVYGENSWEYPIFLSTINKDPELLFEQQKQALLDYIGANDGRRVPSSVSDEKPMQTVGKAEDNEKTFYEDAVSVDSSQPGFSDYAKAAEDTVEDSIKTHNVSQKIAVSLVSGSSDVDKLREEDKLDIKSDLIVADDAEKVKEFKKQGFNAVNIRIASSKEMKGRRGIIIGAIDGKTVRAYLDSVNSELIFYSNNSEFNMGLVNIEDLKIMFKQARLSGINDKMFAGIKRIIITKDAAALETVINAIKNDVTDGLSKPPVSINLDFSGRKDVTPAAVERITGAETNNGLDSNAVIFSYGQISSMSEAGIKALQDKGYEVIAVVSNISEAEYLISNLHINGAVIKTSGRITESELLKIKQMADSNVRENEIIKTQMYVEDVTDDVLASLGDIYEKYSVLPIVAAGSGYLSSNKKCSVRITENDNNSMNIFEKSGVVSVISDKVSTVKKFAGSLTDIISDILKPAAPKQKFLTELRNVRTSGYDFTVTDIKKELSDKDGILFKLAVSGEWFEGEDEKADENKLIEALDTLLSKDILVGFAKSRVARLVEKHKYYEALGCVRGIVEKNVETVILPKLKDAENDKLKKYAGGLLRDALVITGIRILAEGKSIEMLPEDGFINSDMTAQQYFDSIIARLNGQMKDIVKQNEYAIRLIRDENESAQAIADFKDFNLLVQDQIREKSVVKTAGISSSVAVRSILGAA